MDKAALRELAEKASQGDWEAAGPSFGAPLPKYCDEVFCISDGDEETQVCRAPHLMEEECTDDMKFIAAANPQAILSLLAEIQSLTEERTAWRTTAENAEAELKAIKEAEPIGWLVLSTNADGSKSIEYAAEWKDAAHDHISDAIAEYGNTEAGSWIVRPVYTLEGKS